MQKKFYFNFLYISLFIILITINSNFNCLAQVIPTDWSAPRTNGMGGSFTASSNDETSVFSNPAGLSSTVNSKKNSQIQNLFIPNFEVGANTQMFSTMGANPNGWYTNFINSAKDNPGKQSYFLMQSYNGLSYGGKKSLNYLFSLPFRSENKIAFIDPSKPSQASISSSSTLTAALAIAGNTLDGLVRFGISIRPNLRVDHKSSTFDTVLNNKFKNYTDEINNGGYSTSAVGIDTGFILSVADFWFPSFAVSIRNIPTGCTNSYTNSTDQSKTTVCGSMRKGATDSAPNTSKVDPTELRVGVAVTPRGRISRAKVNFRMSLDLYPIPIEMGGKTYGIPNIDFDRMLHAGAEIFFGNSLQQNSAAFRVGYMERGITFGTTLRVLNCKLDYSSHLAVDTVPQLTANSTEIVERRHLIGISFNW
jgi:hypothetical protein